MCVKNKVCGGQAGQEENGTNRVVRRSVLSSVIMAVGSLNFGSGEIIISKLATYKES